MGSNYHIEMNPSDTGKFHFKFILSYLFIIYIYVYNNTLVVQEIIKKTAQYIALNQTSGKKKVAQIPNEWKQKKLNY